MSAHMSRGTDCIGASVPESSNLEPPWQKPESLLEKNALTGNRLPLEEIGVAHCEQHQKDVKQPEEQRADRPSGGRMILTFPIRFYRCFISPILPPACRFYPTCSQYALEALERYGMFKGCWLTLKRLSKCHPYHPGGFDPLK